MIGVAHDISGRKQAEESLRESERRLTLALEAAGAGVWEWEIASNRTIWTEQNARLFGYSPGIDQPSFENWAAAIHPEDRALTLAKVEAAVREGRDLEMEYRLRRRDGTIRWVHDTAKILLDDRGQPQRMLGIILDITQQRQAEAALRQSEERFRRVLRARPDRHGNHLD